MNLASYSLTEMFIHAESWSPITTVKCSFDNHINHLLASVICLGGI